MFQLIILEGYVNSHLSSANKFGPLKNKYLFYSLSLNMLSEPCRAGTIHLEKIQLCFVSCLTHTIQI